MAGKNNAKQESADNSSVEEEEPAPATQFDFDALRAFQNQRNNADMLANMAPAVRRRLKALKRLQLEAINMEGKFFEEVHALECKYHLLYVPMYEKRGRIVNGAYEPTDEEAAWPSDDEEDLSKSLKGVKVEEGDKAPEIIPKTETAKNLPDPKGIPNFWLAIFQNVSLLNEMLVPADELILAHLTDIKVECQEKPMAFTLFFHFSPNEYFTNDILTKEYFMSCAPEEDDPVMFEGPEIYKCKGCTINWNKGKNVTVKTVKKKQKHKSRGVVRTVTKTVQTDSFFNFFTPPEIPDDNKECDDDLRQLLTSDFEIGHYIRERIVPRAVWFYTGEAIENEEDDYDDEDDDEDDDSNEEFLDEDNELKINDKAKECKTQ